MRLTWFFLVFYQGDGEFCVTALETSMHGRFRLTVLKAAASGAERGGAERGADEGSSTLASSTERSMFHPRAALTTPRAVTSSHLVTMAFHESLDVAERDALLDMVRWLHAIVQPAGGGVTRTQLYRAASLVADMRVTQVVNVKKGIHLRFPKAVLEGFVAGTADETRYPNDANNPNEAEDETVGCEGLGFGSGATLTECSTPHSSSSLSCWIRTLSLTSRIARRSSP